EPIEVIKSETARASQVVKDLLAFARRSENRREALDLDILVERTLRLRGFQLADANVAVDLQLDRELPPVVADGRQLQQVVLNLVTNAVQAMAPLGGGTLRVTTRALPGSVVLEITDTGPGIPDRVRAHVFEPFFTTKGEGEGTGLGLSVSYGIITAHGGSIGIADTSPRGTTMVVSLPLEDSVAAAPPPSSERPAAPARSPLAGLRILVVEDEPLLRAGLESFAALRGFAVVAVSNGDAALAALEKTSVDAIVCDLRMPGMDGAALHEILRRDRPGLAARTVFVTGDVAGRAARGGAIARQPVLMKPFSLDRLEEVLVAVLRGQPVAVTLSP
ncbi:MAG TPA: ATP-binding protein, partial [Gemmatimonadaceae bacterium]|nr:ATP-binding protein [Gemmatimonadaceae bacterium]